MRQLDWWENTHLSPMEFPALINWTSPFPFYGLLDDISHFHSNLNRIFCKQTVETVIRRRGLRRQICVCTVCLCPTKRTLTWVNVYTNRCYAGPACTPFHLSDSIGIKSRYNKNSTSTLKSITVINNSLIK